ncbi:Putative ribonuclease H protein [Dendrobium catenatum]|uniref:Ribonuclease H protein n=1 Tax=Dendrobium catenatum TaxID=906689 RepID=A0A2I0XG33_9ASPA|nr:Putative ribonuclease H protein [Dendrobium catenatum]
MECLQYIQASPNDSSLNASLKEINKSIANFTGILATWVIQRAKVKWLKNGEDDLKFLFAKIRCRQGRNNSAVNLFASFPNSVRGEVINSIVTHFQHIYNLIPPHNSDIGIFPLGSAFPTDLSNSITKYVTDEEIKKVVFMGCSTSSPGPDGYNFHFYKSAWHIIGPMVIKAVRSFFVKGYMPSGIKTTAIALIPKFKNAETLADFRPIALCNTFYKIIAKVLAIRIKPIMPILVKDNQSGFIKSRISTDNILLANEIMTYIRKKSGGKYFCAKLDIRKAFDTVSREFLLARLKQKGFPSLVVSWIKACISDVNFSILINGSLEGYFSTSAGLRQGCPLSPYLFCLVMDAFSNLLDAGSFKGISIDGFILTHLLYADDVLIFGEATTENCNSLTNILSTFAKASGLHVNLDKSSILLPKNLLNPDNICRALSIPLISEKFDYLGIPLSFKRLKVSDFLPLIESISKKLSGWKANLLSFAGRLQFLRYTILNSIAYWIRGSIIPKSVFKLLKKMCSKFLFFGDHTAGKKLHMVSWDKCCAPKENGGIGLPSFQALHYATLCSLILRIYNVESPLSTWLFCRYSSPWKPPSYSSSTFWLSVCRTAIAAKAKFHFNITSTAPISLHWDHWYQDCKLETCNDGSSLLNFYHTNSPLKVIISGMSWNIPNFVSASVRNLISEIPILDCSSPCLVWDNSGIGNFSNYISAFTLPILSVLGITLFGTKNLL